MSLQSETKCNSQFIKDTMEQPFHSETLEQILVSDSTVH